MKALRQLKVIDDDLATYLKMLSQDKMKFTYYTFDTKWEESWNIIGIRYQSLTPFLVDVRLMYLDQEARDWNEFVAERDAPGYVTFNPDDYSSVISFFEMLIKKEMLDQGESITHFSLMSLEELAQFHYPQSIVDAAVGNYYRYISDESVQDNERISILRLPHWSAQYGTNQVSSLWFITLSQQQLANPQFDLVDDVDGLGTITFNQSALEELILLLKRRIQSM